MNTSLQEFSISSEHLSSLITLFDGVKPFGNDINYDPDFEAIKAEIGKLGNLNYEMIEQKSISLLTKKSKDIRLFSFLSLCYLKRNELELFCDVYDAVGKFVEKDYNSLFPNKPRAKQLAFKWLSEDRYASVVESVVPPQTAYEHIKRAINALDNIKLILDIEFPNGSPFPLKLYNIFLKWEKLTEPKKQPPSMPSPPPVVNSTSTAQTIVSQTIETNSLEAAKGTNAAEPVESAKDAVEVIRKTAFFLIEKEPLKPFGYRLLRAVRWNNVEKAPLAEGNTTKVEPPAEERRTYIHSLLGKGDFKVALETVEKAFSSGTTHFWLDLQRIAATAAAQLGNTFSAVREAILFETAIFIRRLPQIKDLTFSDGTPFCDSATIDWLNRDVAATLSSDNSNADANTYEPVEIDRREINALVASNNIEKAIDLLLIKIANSGSERDNFRRRVMIASTMIHAKRADLAIFTLEHLTEVIDNFNLHSWEPALAAETYTLLTRAYSIVASGKQGTVQARLLEKREEILKRLSFIDPKAAYKQKQ